LTFAEFILELSFDISLTRSLHNLSAPNLIGNDKEKVAEQKKKNFCHLNCRPDQQKNVELIDTLKGKC
jgi:hypothetical protein